MKTGLKLETIPSVFWKKVSESPEDDAYWFKSIPDEVNGTSKEVWAPYSWSYYGDSVEIVARSLLGLGLKQGVKVCLLCGSRPEWNIFYLACMTIGLVPSSISSSTPKTDVAQIINHLEPELLFLDKRGKYWTTLKDTTGLEHFPKYIVLPKGMDISLSLLPAASSTPTQFYSWSRFICQARSIPRERIFEIQTTLNPLHACSIVYTSGTEGKPKGVVVSHASILATCRAFIAELPPIQYLDRYLAFIAPATIFGQMLCLYIPLFTDLLVHFPPLDPYVSIQSLLKEIQPTLIAAPSEFWSFLSFALHEKISSSLSDLGVSSTGTISPLSLSVSVPASSLPPRTLYFFQRHLGVHKLRTALVGGNSQPVSLDVFHYLQSSLGIYLYEIYGQAETCGLTCANLPDRSHRPSPHATSSEIEVGDHPKFGTVGKALGCDVKISDAGEILVKGPNLFLGYYKENTEKVFEKTKSATTGRDEVWFHTGDYGKWDSRHRLILTGRKSSTITLADGRTFLPLALEVALTSGPLLRNAIIVGSGREYLAAILVLDLVVCKKLSRKKNVTAKELLASIEVKSQMRHLIEKANKIVEICQIQTHTAQHPTTTPTTPLQTPTKQEPEGIKTPPTPPTPTTTTTPGIRKIALLPRHLSVKQRELTSTMSVRRQIVLLSCVSLMNDLYPGRNLLTGSPGPGSSQFNLSALEKKDPKTSGQFYVKTGSATFVPTACSWEEIDRLNKIFNTAKREQTELVRQFKDGTEKISELRKQITKKEDLINEIRIEIESINNSRGKLMGAGAVGTALQTAMTDQHQQHHKSFSGTTSLGRRMSTTPKANHNNKKLSGAETLTRKNSTPLKSKKEKSKREKHH